MEKNQKILFGNYEVDWIQNMHEWSYDDPLQSLCFYWVRKFKLTATIEQYWTNWKHNFLECCFFFFSTKSMFFFLKLIRNLFMTIEKRIKGDIC